MHRPTDRIDEVAQAICIHVGWDKTLAVEVVERLADYNFDTVIDEHVAQQNEFRAAFVAEYCTCYGCGTYIGYETDRRERPNIIRSLSYEDQEKYRHLCDDCRIKEFPELHKPLPPCDLCGSLPSKYVGLNTCLCPACNTTENKRENRRVYNQNNRTHKLGLQSTLTLSEWLEILEKHNYMCAYCKNQPFEEMDHVIPVHLGGGTIASNVVPSCSNCNQSKRY